MGVILLSVACQSDRAGVGAAGDGGSSGSSASGGSVAAAGGSPHMGGGGAGVTDSGYPGGSAADSSDDAQGQHTTPLTYQQWVDLDCDCTPENPCPMLCEGVVVEQFYDEHSYQDVWTGLMCEKTPATILREEPCPEFFSPSCGMFAIARSFSYPLLGRRENVQDWWYDPITWTRTGWSSRFGFPPVRVCGGIAPDWATCPEGSGLSCTQQPPAPTCECPLPE
jgi:hypothetical protein